jgi:hypothetical protein
MNWQQNSSIRCVVGPKDGCESSATGRDILERRECLYFKSKSTKKER